MLVSRGLPLRYTASSLDRCVREGLYEAVRRHLKAGIKIEPWVCARIARSGDRRMVDVFLESGVLLDAAFLKVVIAYGHIDLAIYLIEGSYIVPDESCFIRATGLGNLELVEYLVGKGIEMTPASLARAVQYNNVAVVKRLLELGVEVTNEVLLEACYLDNAEVFSYLAKRLGKDVSALISLSSHVVHFGCAASLSDLI